ncbi:MAG: hypothetical protein J6K32_00940 [Clostridia bacterium]|nr:hypothetical protein [Clostridia bacterium]
MKRMKTLACLLLAAMMMAAALAAADGASAWYYSQLYGYGQFAQYVGEYDGYMNVDELVGGTGVEQTVEVISKSASIWAEPRTNSKKLASASNGESMLCETYNGYACIKDGAFYAVNYKGKSGWVNEAYVVLNPVEITLMESNVPAYIAPDVNSKKVGSLTKHTSYRVIGVYDDFYIVNLRGAAAAFIPMDVSHYDSAFSEIYESVGSRGFITVAAKTSMRTGPADSYAEMSKVGAGKELPVYDIIDGWYLVQDASTGCWGFIDCYDAHDDCFFAVAAGNG